MPIALKGLGRGKQQFILGAHNVTVNHTLVLSRTLAGDLDGSELMEIWVYKPIENQEY